MGRKKTAKIINFSTYSGYSLDKDIYNEEKKEKNKKTKNRKTKNNKRKEGARKVNSKSEKAPINKKQRNKKRKMIGTKFFLFLVFIIAVSCFCLFTPSFNITKIQIENIDKTEYIEPQKQEITENGEEVKEEEKNIIKTNHYTKQEILEMSGIIVGNNIFKTSVLNTEKNIKSAPYIKEVKVKRRLPSTMLISISEREIRAYVDYIGAYMCIDEIGYCVDTIKKGEQLPNIPIIRGISPYNTEKGFVVGEVLDVSDGIKLQRIINLISLIDKNELDLEAEEIDVTQENHVVVTINNGNMKIDFGDMTNMNVKIPFLPSILEDKKDKKGTIYMDSDSDDIQPRFSEIIE